jgi:pimeloyl-ACP methyl ester carboxylesterase
VDEQVADLHAVIEATAAGQVVLAAYSQASPVGIAYARRHRERIGSLVLYAATARVMEAPGYPEGRTVAEARDYVARLAAGWGNGGTLGRNAPTVENDPAVREWVARAERTLGSPRVALQMSAGLAAADVREDARRLEVPTLILHRTGAPAIPVAQGRWLAQHIPGARYVELEGIDHAAYFGGDGRRARGDRGMGDRKATRASRRTGSHDAALHRYRGLDPQGGRARGQGLATPAGAPRR